MFSVIEYAHFVHWANAARSTSSTLNCRIFILESSGRHHSISFELFACNSVKWVSSKWHISKLSEFINRKVNSNEPIAVQNERTSQEGGTTKTNNKTTELCVKRSYCNRSTSKLTRYFVDPCVSIRDEIYSQQQKPTTTRNYQHRTEQSRLESKWDSFHIAAGCLSVWFSDLQAYESIDEIQLEWRKKENEWNDPFFVSATMWARANPPTHNK